jgi:hypothetical protein
MLKTVLPPHQIVLFLNLYLLDAGEKKAAWKAAEGPQAVQVWVKSKPFALSARTILVHK